MKSASSRVQADIMWAKMMDLHQHVEHAQHVSIEATGRKIRLHYAFSI
jgi:hypothetical protein